MSPFARPSGPFCKAQLQDKVQIEALLQDLVWWSSFSRAHAKPFCKATGATQVVLVLLAAGLLLLFFLLLDFAPCQPPSCSSVLELAPSQLLGGPDPGLALGLSHWVDLQGCKSKVGKKIADHSPTETSNLHFWCQPFLSQYFHIQNPCAVFNFFAKKKAQAWKLLLWQLQVWELQVQTFHLQVWQVQIFLQAWQVQIFLQAWQVQISLQAWQVQISLQAWQLQVCLLELQVHATGAGELLHFLKGKTKTREQHRTYYETNMPSKKMPKQSFSPPLLPVLLVGLLLLPVLLVGLLVPAQAGAASRPTQQPVLPPQSPSCWLSPPGDSPVFSSWNLPS